jgi:hypothetical protein
MPVTKGMVSYEWDIETYSTETNDVLDHHFEDSLGAFSKDALREALADNGKRLVLVRYGADKKWAYVENGKLPAFFDGATSKENGYSVPAIFAKEFAAAIEEF